MTFITVVVPALDDAPMVRRCLLALAAQSRPADEIIIVDNGSTDDTAAVALAGGARVLREDRRGILPATAAGFDAARGDILARLDADSVPPADWLARIEAAFDASPELTAITGSGDFYGASALVRWFGRTIYLGGYFWSMGVLLGHPPLFGSNFAIRGEAWRRVRGSLHRDLREIHDDLELSFHLEPEMTVRYDPQLRVGVSARPFHSLAGLGRRLHWAYTTIALNWRERSPWERRSARKALRR